MCGRQTVTTAVRATLAALLLFVITLGTLTGNASAAYASSPRVLPIGKRYPAAVERYRSVVKRYFPKDKTGQVPRRLQQEALAIIMWESGGSTKAGPCEGIWQFSRDHGTHGQRLSVITSTRMAARMYLLQGRRWHPGWAAASRLGLR